jgi:peptidoglycan/xylan/chitin deacetylase (PgdA/CDA1 family)
MRTASRARWVAVVFAAVLALAACDGGTVHHRPRATPRPTPTPTADAVLGSARAFMNLFEEQQFASQWADLAPQAQGQWPSQAARTGMLEKKFQGMTITYTLGAPTEDATWTSQENLDTVSGLWQVPVSVDLSEGPAQLPNTTGLYQQLSLYLTSPAPGLPAQVVGEGPASIDAPVLLPSQVPSATVSVPSLMYHDVDPYPVRSEFPSEYAYTIQYNLTVSPSEFSGQISWLASNGYQGISLARLADALYYGLPLPPKPVVITFDDGFLGQYTNAVPTLMQYHFTATFFICTGLVNWLATTQKYYSWPDMRQMVEDGFWIEDHTVNDDTGIYGLSTAGLDKLIVATQSTIESKLSIPVQFFAYSDIWPYPASTESGPLVDTIFSVLKSSGYQLALTDPLDPSAQVLSSQPYQVPRIRVSPQESIASFAGQLAG